MTATIMNPNRGGVAWLFGLAGLVLLLMPLAPARAQNRNVTVVGQIGGACLAIAAQGNYAFIGEGLSLVVLDIRNPDKPLRAGQLRLKALVQHMALSGTTLYAALGEELVMIDVSSPTAPTLKGYYDLEGQIIAGLAVSGTTVYLGGGASFQVVDAANPAAPRLLGSVPLSVTGLALTGTRVCIINVDSFGSFWVVDVSNPSQPRPRGHLTGLDADRVAATGTAAYLTLGGLEALQAVDLSNPDKPALKGSIAGFNFINDLAAAGTKLYLTDSDGLHVIDAANPEALQPLGTLALGQNSLTLKIAGTLALIFDYDDGFEIVDVSNDASPRLRGRYTSLVRGGSLALAGRRAYVTDVERGMAIIDLGAPARPTLAGFFSGAPSIGVLTVAGRYAYLTSGYRAMKIVDVGNPAAPQVLSTYPAHESVWAAKVAGSLAYLTYGFDQSPSGLEIIDVSNPAAPARKGIFEKVWDLWAADVLLSGPYAYLADHYGGIQVMDVSNPAAPTPKGLYLNPIDFYYYMDLALKGSWLYASFYWAGGAYGIDVFDVSDPNNPRRAGGYSVYDEPGIGRGLDLAGNRLYAALGEAGLGIFDLTSPDKPLLAGGYGTATSAVDVATTGGLICLSDSELGLVVLQQVSAPVRVTSMSQSNLGLERALPGRELYTDRGITLKSGIPSFLSGQLMIQLPDDARDSTSSAFLSFYIDRSAEIDIAVDARRATVPGWLKGWVRLADTLPTGDPLSPNRAIYRKFFPKGLVTLGPNRTQAMPRGYRMYTVIVSPFANAVREWIDY